MPNAGLYIRHYVESKNLMETLTLKYQPGISPTNSYIDQVNYVAYMNGQHKYMFYESNLIEILKMVGFSNVKLSEFDEKIDLPIRNEDSLYAIGSK